MSQLRPVHHFGTRVLLWLELENLGRQPVTYPCPHCRAEREHFARVMASGNHFAVCRTCGQGSKIEDTAPAAGAGQHPMEAPR